MKKLYLTIFITFLIVMLLCSCSKGSVTKQGFYFDTVINITVDKANLSAAEEAFGICADMESIFSRTRADSELYKINNKSTSHLSASMQEVLEFSLKLSETSDGAFDITVAPLCDLWNIKERTTPPFKEEIKKLLPYVGYEKISLSPFSSGGASIDLGSVAKGYAADRIAESFRNKGIDKAIIDLGGNVQLIGEYSVGIRDPFNPDALFAKIKLKDKSAVTSGAYQRYFDYNGVRYHHIIDPRTGECAQSGIASVTVISPSSMQADALSTAIYVLGEDGLSLCDKFSDTDAFLITDNGDIITTDGFSEKYSLDILTKK